MVCYVFIKLGAVQRSVQILRRVVAHCKHEWLELMCPIMFLVLAHVDCPGKGAIKWLLAFHPEILNSGFVGRKHRIKTVNFQTNVTSDYTKVNTLTAIPSFII